MLQPAFALIDCNNFFVGCEKLFQPELEGRPVVVLSSNDGCAVARSNEAKALGIPMGAPAFKYRQLFKQEGVVTFSANFELYGDISERITRLLTGITPRTEVYSVDEAFLDLSQLEITDYTTWGGHIRDRIQREVGMPISIGFAPSKTLAKLASERAKKDAELANVLDLINSPLETRHKYLLRTPIKDIWGVGWRLAPQLKAQGVFTALDLAQMRPQLAGQMMGVHGRQMVAELNGTACLQLHPLSKTRQSIMRGRLFGADTDDPLVIEAAIASLTARATQRLRKEKLLARYAGISLGTNRHKPGYERLKRGLMLPLPSDDTGAITAELLKLIAGHLRTGHLWHRADIYLHDFISRDRLQVDLLGSIDVAAMETSQARMQALDALNERYGPNTISFAAAKLSRAWEPKHAHRSPRYTTQWSELPEIS